MAQTFPTSAKVIYDTLVADTEFMALLGTYTFASSGAVPAISVVSPGQSLPEIRNVEGLECVIQDAGDIKRMDYVAGASDMAVTYRMYLVCWEEAEGQDMTSAAIRALEIFGGATAIETVAAADGLGALAQVQIRIPSNKPILA
jgi:hypothetical protein